MTLPKLHVRDLFWLVLVVGIGCTPQKPTGMKILRYSDCSFSGSNLELNMFWVGGKPRDYKVKRIYIRDADGKVHDLSSISEETALSWVDRYTDEVWRDRAVDHGRRGPFENVTVCNFPGRSLLCFHKGKLIDGCMRNLPDGPFNGLEVSRSPDGPFLKVPARHEDVIQSFGTPEKVEWAQLNGS